MEYAFSQQEGRSRQDDQPVGDPNASPGAFALASLADLRTSDPLKDFQAKMDQILGQANAQLGQAESEPYDSTEPSAPGATTPRPEQTEELPPAACQGPIPLSNSTWHGWPDCTICPSCYHTFAAATALAEVMPLHNILVPAQTVCDLYSPRQRARYLNTCKTGDINNFLSACRERSKTWEETVGVILAQRQEAAAKAEIMNVSAGVNRLMEGYNSMSGLGGDDDAVKEKYWTESGGVYSSYNGVVAEREEEEAEGLWTAAAELGDEEVLKLEARWTEIE